MNKNQNFRFSLHDIKHPVLHCNYKKKNLLVIRIYTLPVEKKIN